MWTMVFLAKGKSCYHRRLSEYLQKKREDSLVLIKSVKNILEESKVEAYFEWPSKNDGLKQAEVEELMKSLPYETEVDGCAYDLKSSDGGPMKKT